LAPKSASRSKFLIALFVLLLGCSQTSDQAVDDFFSRLQKEWDALLIVLQGGASPLAKRPPKPAASPSEGLGVSAATAKANGELLREVYVVVFGGEPADRNEFGSNVDSMNQGASLEGMYNGFTHSSHYRELEEQNPGARPEALQAFAEELTLLELQLPTPTDFPRKASLPLAKVREPGEPPEAEPSLSSVEPLSALGASPKPDALAGHYKRVFEGASISR
jgi:hypothetical protein